MSVGKLQCTYERIILIKRLPYWVYWPVIGTLGFFAGEFLIRIFGEKHYFWTQILFAVGVALLPIGYIWMFHGFRNTVQQLSPLLWVDSDEFGKWLETRSERIFTLRHWFARSVTGAIVVGALLTIGALGLPFSSIILNLLALGGFAVVLFICGQAAYTLGDLLFTLREVVQRAPTVPFYLLPHPAVTNLQAYYSVVALLTTLAYCGLVVAVWQGPYGLGLAMQLWLTWLAIFPLSSFFYSFFQVHVLMRNAKQFQVHIINREIQLALGRALDSNRPEEVERLNGVMDVQHKIQATKEWPIDIQATLTFLLALGALIIQVSISAFELLQP